ncbi:MAG: carbohydrate porin [Burkholderiales bacterium]|nr:carbohydrate porin [Burkholderiales bacterium]MDE2609649.1 carbohydrate porin [Burkholderiales bacterium]
MSIDKPLNRLSPRAGTFRRILLVGLWSGTLASPLLAHAADGGNPSDPAQNDLWTRQTLLGDMWGIRPALARYGITFSLNETSEYLNNLRGGIRRGGTYDGLTTATVQVDTQKAFGWAGGTFNVSALQIHGRNLSPNYLGSIQTASGIEADDTTRLWELWYQQSLLNDRMSIRVGQQSLDQEFMNSPSLGLFVNTMFGWPTVPSYDMPSGGPAYPLSALGVRVSYKLANNLTALAGVFDGNSTGATPSQDSQKIDGSGTKFNLHNGALWIGELQYNLNPTDGGASSGLPGVYKIGVWYNTNRFADQGFDTNGVSLASAQSNGVGYPHRGNYSLYGIVDQMIWRESPTSARSVNFFTRVMGAPGDRNPISFSANAGLVMHAPLPGRDNDSAGIGVGYAKVGNHAVALDRANASVNGGFSPVRSDETFVEATYQYQVAPWWQLQADAQYTFNVGGGIVDPNNPTQKIGNTFVVGVRTSIAF